MMKMTSTLNKYDLAIIGVVILLVIVLVFTLFFVVSDGSKCLANPFGYQLDKMAKGTGEEYSCNCINSGIKPTPFFISTTLEDNRIGGFNLSSVGN